MFYDSEEYVYTVGSALELSLDFLKSPSSYLFRTRRTSFCNALVDGEECDIIYSFGTSTLRASYGFILEPRRVIFNPVNKTSISSIRIYITDGLRRPVYLNNADTAFSLILKRVI